MKIQLEIPGVPVAKARPKFSTRGGFAKAYKTAAQSKAERLFVGAVKHQLGQMGKTFPVCAGAALRVSCWFYMPIPASSTKKFRGLCLGGRVYHTKKPDTDNLVKFVKDCLNKVVWHDDSQVAVIRGMKLYGAEPGTIVLIETLEGVEA